MKGILGELVYVIRSLEKNTKIKIISMVIVTFGLCWLMLSTIENPVIERWKEDRDIEHRIEDRDFEEGEDSSDPVY